MSWILIKLAWKNLFRHKRRSLIAATAMGIGLAALIFADALWLGMERNMVKTATASFLGDAQIHREGFSDEQAVELTVNQLDAVVANLRREGIVAHFTLRTFAFGMITSPATVAAVNLVGVEPSTEQYLSLIDDAIVEGAYFEGLNPRDIVMGEELAERLEVGLNDRIVVTMAQAGSGDLSQEMFRVSGIYRFADEGMNSGMAFIRLGKAQQMLALGAGAHEIALKFIDSTSAEDQSLLFWKTYSQGETKRAVGQRFCQRCKRCSRCRSSANTLWALCCLAWLFLALSIRCLCRFTNGCLNLACCEQLARVRLAWRS